VDLILKNEFRKAVLVKDGTINAVDLHLKVEKKKPDVDSFYQLIRSLS